MTSSVTPLSSFKGSAISVALLLRAGGARARPRWVGAGRARTAAAKRAPRSLPARPAPLLRGPPQAGRGGPTCGSSRWPTPPRLPRSRPPPQTQTGRRCGPPGQSRGRRCTCGRGGGGVVGAGGGGSKHITSILLCSCRQPAGRGPARRRRCAPDARGRQVDRKRVQVGGPAQRLGASGLVAQHRREIGELEVNGAGAVAAGKQAVTGKIVVDARWSAGERRSARAMLHIHATSGPVPHLLPSSLASLPTAMVVQPRAGPTPATTPTSTRSAQRARRLRKWARWHLPLLGWWRRQRRRAAVNSGRRRTAPCVLASGDHEPVWRGPSEACVQAAGTVCDRPRVGARPRGV